MGKSCNEQAPKASSRHLYNFGKYPKTDISKKDYQKALYFFLLNPVPFNRQDYE